MTFFNTISLLLFFLKTFNQPAVVANELPVPVI